MSKETCPGIDGLFCIGGWLYSGFGGMVFPTNRKCPTCQPPEIDIAAGYRGEESL